MPRDVLLAAVIGAHGLKGEVRVKTFTESPDALTRYGALHLKDGRAVHVATVHPTKPGEAILSFRGVTDRNAAEALKGEELLVSREALPRLEGHEFYHADLIGLRAEDEEGRVIGTVHAIHNFGAGDVIEIARSDGDTVLLAFTRENVPVIEIALGRITVAVPEAVEAQEPRGNVE
jgi:16S rRNA processing protein RimM